MHPTTARRRPRYMLAKWRRLTRVRLLSARRAMRDMEAGIILFGALIGAVVSVCIVGLHLIVELAHIAIFSLSEHELLSAQLALPTWRLALVPAGIGLVLGVTAYVLNRIRPAEIVDPVEANALYGGKMSFRDSCRLTFLTLISNASGASVGMEAGYSQLGASIFSFVGKLFHLRRNDLRCMTTAGAAAAIAAAFNTPLAGAFYGFELVHSTYTTRNVAIVITAAVTGAMVRRAIWPGEGLFVLQDLAPVTDMQFALFLVLALLAAGLGIVTMKATIWCEGAFRKSRLPVWSRPAFGGAILSLIAFACPQVLGSGHGAIQAHLETQWTALALALLLVGKVLGSAVSLGSGFRGGLFSSSLFIGCLLGALFADLATVLDPSIADARMAFILVGMGAVGAAIIGAPLTMAFLVLETTGDFNVSIGVLAGVVVASAVVRLTFGYSFSTWRFHLRGLPVGGGQDVGWIRELTAGRLMRSDFEQVSLSLPLARLRERVPLGRHKYVIAVDQAGRFAGLVDITSAYDPELVELTEHLLVADLVTPREKFLLPGTDIKSILERFSTERVEVMPVVDNAQDMRVRGLLSESYATRRYAQELEKRHHSELGVSA